MLSTVSDYKTLKLWVLTMLVVKNLEKMKMLQTSVVEFETCESVTGMDSWDTI